MKKDGDDNDGDDDRGLVSGTSITMIMIFAAMSRHVIIMMAIEILHPIMRLNGVTNVHTNAAILLGVTSYNIISYDITSHNVQHKDRVCTYNKYLISAHKLLHFEITHLIDDIPCVRTPVLMYRFVPFYLL